jgi:hypothetical protein
MGMPKRLQDETKQSQAKQNNRKVLFKYSFGHNLLIFHFHHHSSAEPQWLPKNKTVFKFAQGGLRS